MDPLAEKYPVSTPYQYASDNPATNIDVDGLEGFNPNGYSVGTAMFEAAGINDGSEENEKEFAKGVGKAFVN